MHELMCILNCVEFLFAMANPGFDEAIAISVLGIAGNNCSRAILGGRDNV